MFLSLFTHGKNAKDPVCGKSVPKEEAASFQFVGETYYFCSERCRDRFQALPTKYLDIAIKLPDSASSGGGCC